MVILKSENTNFANIKKPISIKNIDVNKVVVSNKDCFGKNVFKYFIGYKDPKKLGLYVCFSPKRVHEEETLMELNICPGLPNFKKAMAILILASLILILILILDLGFGVPRCPKNAFPSLVPWTCHCHKAPHFLFLKRQVNGYFVVHRPRNIHSPASLKKPVQLQVQISVASNSIVLNSTFYCSEEGGGNQGVMGHLIKSYKNLKDRFKLKRKTIL